MSSIYLVRRGELWLHVWEQESEFLPFVAGAACYATRKDAEVAASLFTGAEPVEFREVAGDTAAGALAAAEATIARLRQDLELLRKEIARLSTRPSTHELAKRYLESTDG